MDDAIEFLYILFNDLCYFNDSDGRQKAATGRDFFAAWPAFSGYPGLEYIVVNTDASNGE